MTDSEKRAHDLAILYMQMEIKEGQLVISYEQDFEGFVNHYKNLASQFIEQLP